MTTILIDHFLYGRVEGEYSPRRRSGFQTIYSPKGSDPSDIEALEKRLLCFQPDRSNRIRLQFFTHNRLVVVGHTCRVEPHLEIIDRNGRTGAFIAHCLVVPRATFAELGNDPFVLFDNYRFVTTPEGLRAFLQDEANRPAQLSVELTAVPAATDWEGSEVRRLWSLAMQAAELTQAGQSQQFVGSDSEIHDALRAAFSLVQPDQRLACSFDSCVDGCQISSGTYWAIGTASLRSGGTAYVDTAARSIVGQMKEAQAQDNLYAAWLWSATDRQDFAAMLQHAPTIQRIAVAFRARTAPPEETLRDLVGCQEFLQHHRQSVVAGVEAAVAEYFKQPALSSALAERYVAREKDLPRLLSTAASQQMAPKTLAKITDDWVSEQGTIADVDARQLADLGKRASHLRLAFLGAIAQRRPDTKLRDAVLARMDLTQYQGILDTFGKRFPLNQFVARDHFDTLLSYVTNGRSLSNDEIVDLVEAIIADHGASKLGPLAPMLAGLSRGHLQKIQKLIGSYSETSVAFRHTLEEHLKQQPGILDRLRKLL